MAEMIRKGQPTQSDVHVNAPLTNISIAYMQSADKFVADRVFPNIPVAKQSDLYWSYDRGYFNRAEMKKRAAGTESAGADYAVDSDGSYFCDVWALHKDIDDQVRANTDSPLQADREATEFLTQQALLKREILWTTDFFAASKWTTDLTPTTLWDQPSSDPLGEIETGVLTIGESTGLEPNKAVLGRKVWGTLKHHADIVDRIKYGQTPGGPAKTAVQAFAELIEVDEVLISKAIKNTALEGATNSHSYVAGSHMLLVYAAPSPGLMTPSGGYTFSWNGYSGAAAAGQRIMKIRAPLLHSDRVEIEMAFDHKLISADLGYFFNTVLT